MPSHNYLFAPTREPWPASSVNSRIAPIPTGKINKKTGEEKIILASQWLDQNRPVEQMTWAPGRPMLIENKLIDDGGWIEREGVNCLNLYRPPTLNHGDPDKAARWLDHVRHVFPDDTDHIIKFLAHRVQRPWEKINHMLFLGGCEGIGKDTVVEPVKRAVGPWNVKEVSPTQVMGRFNGYLKSVILRVSEARDLGETDRFKFYDHLKTITAAPPDVLRVDEKNLREHSIVNVCAVVVTSNHKNDGIYLPDDSRRAYVAWSDLTKADFSPEYWTGIYRWYDTGGAGHVAAYLAQLDLSGFDPKAPPPLTAAFWEIVNASRAPENAELADVLDQLGNPDTITIQQLIRNAEGSFAEWLGDRRNSRQIPHRLDECGYVAVRNTAPKDGLWKYRGKRQVIYAKAALPLRDRYRIVEELADEDAANRRRPE
jgi:hypothetical protein